MAVAEGGTGSGIRMTVAANVEEPKQVEVTPGSRVASYAPVRRPLVWFGRVTQESVCHTFVCC